MKQIYWALWWQNLLSPSLCLYILFALLKRRIFPYPSLEDLLRHREEVLRADEFGERVSAKLSASSSSVMEIWRLFRLFEKTKRNIVKGKPRETTKDKSTTDEPEGRHSSDLVEDDVTVLDDIDDSEEAKDLKRIGLEILEDIAELHERVRKFVSGIFLHSYKEETQRCLHSLFIWRRPASSRRYAFVRLPLTELFSCQQFFFSGALCCFSNNNAPDPLYREIGLFRSWIYILACYTYYCIIAAFGKAKVSRIDFFTSSGLNREQ